MVGSSRRGGPLAAAGMAFALLLRAAPAAAVQNATAAGALVVSDDQCRFNYRLRRCVLVLFVSCV